MRNGVDEALNELAHQRPLEMRVLQLLAKCLAPGTHGAVVGSREALHVEMGVSVSTIDRSIRRLEQDRWLPRRRLGNALVPEVNAAATASKVPGLAHASRVKAIVVLHDAEQPGKAEDDRARDLRKLPLRWLAQAALPARDVNREQPATPQRSCSDDEVKKEMERAGQLRLLLESP